MNEYEITYIADSQLDEAGKTKLDEAVDADINKLAATITYSSPDNSPGNRRRLHYPIGQQRVAWLRTLQLQLDPDKIETLRATLKKTDGILRVSVLQTPRREEVSASIFDIPKEAPATTATDKKTDPAKKTTITETELEEKIEEALTEEIK